MWVYVCVYDFSYRNKCDQNCVPVFNRGVVENLTLFIPNMFAVAYDICRDTKMLFFIYSHNIYFMCYLNFQQVFSFDSCLVTLKTYSAFQSIYYWRINRDSYMEWFWKKIHVNNKMHDCTYELWADIYKGVLPFPSYKCFWKNIRLIIIITDIYIYIYIIRKSLFHHHCFILKHFEIHW